MTEKIAVTKMSRKDVVRELIKASAIAETARIVITRWAAQATLDGELAQVVRRDGNPTGEWKLIGETGVLDFQVDNVEAIHWHPTGARAVLVQVSCGTLKIWHPEE